MGAGASGYKEMDLHGFPLSVAKAAIDFVFSEIADGAIRAGTAAAAAGCGGGTASDTADSEGGDGTVFDLDRALDSVAFDLKIVTGRGKHTNSSGTRGVLRGELEAYLLDGVRPVGCLAVTRVSGNDGVLVVPRSSVRIWLRARLLDRLGRGEGDGSGSNGGQSSTEEAGELQ